MKDDKSKMFSRRIPESLSEDMKELSKKFGTNWTHELVQALQQRVEFIKELHKLASAQGR